MEVLDRTTCFELLRSVVIGRVAWAAEDGTTSVLPVNFVLDGEHVVFRTADGSKLAAVRAGRPLSFEVDEVEPAMHVGWSVLLVGRAEVISDPADLHRIEQLRLAPWEPESKHYVVRLRARDVTGRRLPLHKGGVTVEHQQSD